MLYDFIEQAPASRYKLMSQSVIPRPIAWIVTEDGATVNVAPFSYFTPLSSEPPTLIVSVGHKSDGIPKDTLSNLRRHGVCTVCMVGELHLDPMHFSSKELPHAQSEVETFDIATEAIVTDFPPIISGAPVAFFCRLHQELDLGGKTVPLVLQIEKQFVRDDCLSDPERLTIRYDPVARTGRHYAFLGEAVTPPEIPES